MEHKLGIWVSVYYIFYCYSVAAIDRPINWHLCAQKRMGKGAKWRQPLCLANKLNFNKNWDLMNLRDCFLLFTGCHILWHQNAAALFTIEQRTMDLMIIIWGDWRNLAIIRLICWNLLLICWASYCGGGGGWMRSAWPKGIETKEKDNVNIGRKDNEEWEPEDGEQMNQSVNAFTGKTLLY